MLSRMATLFVLTSLVVSLPFVTGAFQFTVTPVSGTMTVWAAVGV